MPAESIRPERSRAAIIEDTYNNQALTSSFFGLKQQSLKKSIKKDIKFQVIRNLMSFTILYFL
ncbi:hypothetical protein CIL05_17635 [Virgibacillus profundi]|uniref:Uncharacterized protein n=1 Tax=Virgibacillus profundi TaxID=2024555 RepID=A0A2A2I9Y3_9BACI|nr:hypothetical protein CIL05_17635 [Virgibacillus profundi]PXY52493.1 hypothetical protein CIT14_17070 [Virgibacillus profundi]